MGESTVNFEELLTSIAESDAIKVWIPSKSTHYLFKQLTFEQHTEFLKLQSDEDNDVLEATYKFTALLNKTIVESCLTPHNLLEELTIIDRNAIALQLRVALDDKFRIKLGERMIDISLKNHVSFVSTIGKDRFVRDSKIAHGFIALTLDIPSLAVDQAVNNDILTFDGDSEVFPSFLLLAELVKFVKTIELNVKGEIQEFHMFKQGQIAQSIAICQKIPLAALNLVSEYIQNVQKVEAEIMTVTVPIPDVLGDEPRFESVPILINTNWFTSV